MKEIKKEDMEFYEKVKKLYSKLAQNYCDIEDTLFFQDWNIGECPVGAVIDECNDNEAMGWYLAEKKLIDNGYNMEKYSKIEKQIYSFDNIDNDNSNLLDLF